MRRLEESHRSWIIFPFELEHGSEFSYQWIDDLVSTD